jgi:hypothetical protein
MADDSTGISQKKVIKWSPHHSLGRKCKYMPSEMLLTTHQNGCNEKDNSKQDEDAEQLEPTQSAGGDGNGQPLCKITWQCPLR